MSELAFSSLAELARGLEAGRYSAVELARHYLARIARANEALHAYVSVDEAGALRLAQAADARRAAGYALGPLDGLPIAIKDLCEIEGQVTTAGSAAWRERRSKVTGTAVRRLLAAGMVVLGKTHMVEFVFGGWGTNPVMGTPRNPWDLSHPRIPGGSSSGSGVAVAAGLAPAALGSDTGGSVRIPAALNGITGLKTSAGLISLHGAVPLSQTLDSIGPMTRDAYDAMLLVQALAGPDAADPATLGVPALVYAPPREGGRPLAGRRIAVMAEENYPLAVSADVALAVRQAADTLRALGAEVATVATPFDFTRLMHANGRIIAAEAYVLHRGYIDDAALPLGEFVRARVQSGRAIGAADYIAAMREHAQARAQWRAWMQDYDALLTPSLPFAACRLDEVDEQGAPLAAFSRAGNFLGASGLALPAGFSADGLPVGVQLMGKPFDDGLLCGLGVAFQQATDWHLRTPDLRAAGLA
ncbi:amidase [Bordetella pertussis]|uniref:amidase n=1 Tax=Bordetella pertussis TaxID=520 RepID=UPI0005E28D7F|nr:amidase [Bordetella pertussis]CFN35139.1 amidase [Bordetella pertussis]CPQ81436.1 amidase [Bordetella pertussis]